MTYHEYVLSVFIDHQDCKGLPDEEIQDLIEESSFSRIENYLLNSGYNLSSMYEADCI